MDEGAWINAGDGRYRWITEHASWIQDPAHAASLGVDPATLARIREIPRDFDGPGRRRILREAMGAGFIRVRGHGAVTTFEGTLDMAALVAAALPFMAEHFGPEMGCRFNRLVPGDGLEPGSTFLATYGDLALAAAEGRLAEFVAEGTA